nr:retrovirus-related Pol polyprotein from transposon TNT 1-94 [Tanacetum cinerariifolium]
ANNNVSFTSELELKNRSISLSQFGVPMVQIRIKKWKIARRLSSDRSRDASPDLFFLHEFTAGHGGAAIVLEEASTIYVAIFAQLYKRNQQGCNAALETLLADMEAEEKETTAAGIWTKLTSPYLTKSLANRFYLRKKLYTYYMSPGMKLGDHINEFNKLILDLANIDIEIEDEDEDQALMLFTSLPLSYESFMETLLYGRKSLTIEDQ